nr:unnamed protein product [Callosobruchus chinensis]
MLFWNSIVVLSTKRVSTSR